MILTHHCSKSGLCVAILTFCFLNAFAQENADALNDIQVFREKQLAEFKERVLPYFTSHEKKKFHGLNYYPVNLEYRLTARFVQTDNQPVFKMKTTTTRLPEYRKFGEVYFSIEGKEYKLNVYQSPDLMKKEGFEDYLFIPFTDKTNGSETYDVGRYIEMHIPKDETVTLDFNQAYNPYCSYNSAFSCPIPPAENDLPIAIPVGERKFHD